MTYRRVASDDTQSIMPDLLPNGPDQIVMLNPIARWPQKNSKFDENGRFSADAQVDKFWLGPFNPPNQRGVERRFPLRTYRPTPVETLEGQNYGNRLGWRPSAGRPRGRRDSSFESGRIASGRTTPYGAPWMNGSADCDQCSPMATDEEPPGPLDLTSSILSTDLTYSGESVSVDTAAPRVTGFAPALTPR